MPTSTMPFAKALATNSDDTSFASRVPTITEPADDGVITLAKGGVAAPMPYDQMIVVPYGAGADNDTFDMRIIGWRLSGTLWIPVPLVQLSVTLSTAVGVAGEVVTASERFADTLTITLGNSNVDVSIISPAAASLNNLIAQAMLDIKGYSKVEFTFARTGTTTECNCLYALV